MSVYLPLQIESRRPKVQPPLLHVFVVVPCVLSLYALNNLSADTLHEIEDLGTREERGRNEVELKFK